MSKNWRLLNLHILISNYRYAICLKLDATDTAEPIGECHLFGVTSVAVLIPNFSVF